MCGSGLSHLFSWLQQLKEEEEQEEMRTSAQLTIVEEEEETEGEGKKGLFLRTRVWRNLGTAAKWKDLDNWWENDSLIWIN